MTTEQPQKIWSGIDLAKIGAGGLAAVSAAVAASSLGVAGTLIGAALASVIGTVGTEVYANSLKRGYGRLRKARPGTVRVPRTGDAVPVPPATDPDDPAATTVIPVTSPAAGEYGPVAPARPRWKRIALITVAVFALAMAAIWVLEVAAGASLASVFGDDSAGTTTIGTVLGDDSGGDEQTPAPGTTPTDDTEVSPTVTTTPEPDTTTSAPDTPPDTTGPTGGPTDPPVATVTATVPGSGGDTAPTTGP